MERARIKSNHGLELRAAGAGDGEFDGGVARANRPPVPHLLLGKTSSTRFRGREAGWRQSS